MDLTASYTAVAADWDRLAGPVYRALAEDLIGWSRLPLSGARLVDVGAGAGAVAAAASAAGATVLTTDRVLAMRPHSVGDVLRLPFRRRAFDVAAAGFVLNHVEPRAALEEMGRVADTVLASTWAVDDPLKAELGDLQRARGWVPPAWFTRLKADVEPVSGHPDRLADAAASAGLSDVRVSVERSSRGWTSEQIVAFRWSMPHIGPWVQSLDRTERVDLWDEMVDAARSLAADWRPAVILLAASARATRASGRQPGRTSRPDRPPGAEASRPAAPPGPSRRRRRTLQPRTR